MAFTYTEEQLNKLDSALLVQLILGLQEQNEKQAAELHEINEKMQLMMEQLVLGDKNRFGRSSEKMEAPGQLCFIEVDGKLAFFNEAEAVCDPEAAEPESLELPHKRGKKARGKKDEDISGLEKVIVTHYLTDAQLAAEFGPGGWKQLPDEVSTRYLFVPASVKAEEHHTGVYAAKNSDRIIKAPHPKALLRGSLVSPTIAAAVMNGKYVNAVPLYRLEQEFLRYGLSITRQNMANWMIRLGEGCLGVMYDYLHRLLYGYHVIQADETPVLVNRDGRPAGSKSYMWVYRSGFMYDRHIVLYEYQKTRNATHPEEFLKGFSGVCVTDGYQVYHTLEKKRGDLMIAGCWVHMRRKFNDVLETIKDEDGKKKSMAYPVMCQVQAIYREEGKLKDMAPEEREQIRQAVVKPLVDALFVYLHNHAAEVAAKGKLHEAFTYALNQEKYLRVFLGDGDVPMDNNASERAIRGFCIGKKNWEMIDTVNGAKSSAVIYSIAETAKANSLKPYDYFVHLLEEIPKHMDETDMSFLEKLLPWSPNLPESIRKPKA